MFGCILYLAVGMKIVGIGIELSTNAPEDLMSCGSILKATGSLSIISSLVYFVETTLVGFDLFKHSE